MVMGPFPEILSVTHCWGGPGEVEITTTVCCLLRLQSLDSNAEVIFSLYQCSCMLHGKLIVTNCALCTELKGHSWLAMWH